jgi:asparagine synthase (glutamine-hydrolysing)
VAVTLTGRFDFTAGRAVHEGPSDAAHSPSGSELTWDGRLDNRSELPGWKAAAVRSDARLALDVFERHGIRGLRSLVGDWSLAHWDAPRRMLHLARDYMGARPLYYSVDDRGISWSSDLAWLVERGGRRDALRDLFAAHFMSQRPLPAITPYEGIHPVPTGGCVSITADAVARRTTFWTLRIDRLRYADPRDYERHLRSLWRDAVGARLRGTRVVWAELSGGLDSSSVVCMADRLIRRGEVDATELRLVSHATLQSPEGDERRFIAEVEQQVGIRSEIIGVEDHQPLVDPEHAWVTPYAVQGVGLATVRRVLEGGGRLVLSGRLGDAVMGCQPDNSASVFDDGGRWDPLGVLRRMRAWSRATHKPFVEIAWRLFAPEAPPADTGAALLTPRLRQMLLDAPDASRAVTDIPRSKRALAAMVLAYTNGRLDIPHYPPEVAYTYPFAHRPLVEFVLAIPGEELSAPGVTRSLMRRAFADLLPPRVLNRQSKGYYPPAALRAARRQIASILSVDALEVVQRGWIDADRLRQALRTLADGGGESGGDVHRVLHLERWLQARQTRSAIPQRKEVNSHAVLNA